MKQIKTLTELKAVLKDHRPHEFRLSLNGGMYSKKTIVWVRKLDKHGIKSNRTFFLVTNHIDDSRQTLDTKTLFDKNHTNVGFAMKRGAFWFIK